MAGAVIVLLSGCRTRATTSEPGSRDDLAPAARHEPAPARDATPPPAFAQLTEAIALPLDGSLWLCADGRVRRWSWTPTSVSFDAACTRGLRVSADGRTVLTASEQRLWVHDTEVDEPPRAVALALAPDDHVVDLALSATGRQAAVITESGLVKTVDVETGRTRTVQVANRVGSVRSSTDDSTFARLRIARDVAPPRLAWSGDGTTLALVAAVRDIEAETMRGRVFTWHADAVSARASEPFEVLDRRARGHLTVAASPTEDRFVVGSGDGAVHLFDRHRLVWSSVAASAPPVSFGFAADAQRFAVAYADGAVRIFGPIGTADALELWPDVGDLLSVAFSADGDKLVLTVDSGPVALVDARNGEVLARMAVLARGWVVVSAAGAVEGTDAGLEALADPRVADLLGWDRDHLPRAHRSPGLLAGLLAAGSTRSEAP